MSRVWFWRPIPPGRGRLGSQLQRPKAPRWVEVQGFPALAHPPNKYDFARLGGPEVKRFMLKFQILNWGSYYDPT